jgi:hypothetical protein
MTAKTKSTSKKKKVKNGGAPSSKTKSKGLDPKEYVRNLRLSTGQGCGICLRPDIKANVEAIQKECQKTGTKLSNPKLRLDLQQAFAPWKIGEKKFDRHMNGSCGG